MSHARHLHLIEIELASDAKAAPDWVMLIPAGPEVPSTDGRRRRLSNPQSVVDTFKTRAIPKIPVDVEHATHRLAPQGQAAPAYGWVVDMDVREGAVWGRVDWTEQGAAWVAGKNYKFLSAGYRVDKASGEITQITDMGLTNNPGFAMPELASATGDDKEKDTMDKAIAEALGLTETASAADAVVAIGKLKESAETAKAAPPDPDKFVPKAQLDAVNAKLSEHEATETARADTAAVAAVEAAIAEGKIAPAAKDMMVETAKSKGAEAFTASVKDWPKLISDTKALDDKTTETAKSKSHGLTETEIAVASQAGMTAAEFAKAKEEEKEA